MIVYEIVSESFTRGSPIYTDPIWTIHTLQPTHHNPPSNLQALDRGPLAKIISFRGTHLGNTWFMVHLKDI